MKRTLTKILPLTGLALATAVTAYAATGHVNTTKITSRRGRKSVSSSSNSSSNIEKKILAQAPNLTPAAVKAGITAYDHAEAQGLDKKHLLTLIDFKQPSTQKSLYVINMNNGNIKYNTLVAHGKNSGNDYATKFSNNPGSDQSSLGVYLTGNTYSGEHGYSMRLNGLEKGFNSNARSRAVVMHSAWYVSKAFAKAHGYLGRSWGCTALSQKMEPKVVKAIHGGTVLFAYYPSKHYMQTSKYMQPMSNGVVSV